MRKLMRSMALAGMVESGIGGINRPPTPKATKSKFASMWRRYFGYVANEKPQDHPPISRIGRKMAALNNMREVFPYPMKEGVR